MEIKLIDHNGEEFSIICEKVRPVQIDEQTNHLICSLTKKEKGPYVIMIISPKGFKRYEIKEEK